MPSTPRQRGDYFERQAKHALEAVGWIVVRSAGSLGPADLVAVRRNSAGHPHVLLISCKLDGRCSPAERAALLAAADTAAAEPLVASRPTKGVVVLATVGDRLIRSQLKVPPRPRPKADPP